MIFTLPLGNAVADFDLSGTALAAGFTAEMRTANDRWLARIIHDVPNKNGLHRV